jgi:urease accessory protein UreF
MIGDPLAVHASSVLLTLADGRLPAGGHAHSGGLEEAVATGRVSSASDLAGFLAGRLQSTGRVDAGLASLSCWASPSLPDLFTLQSEALAGASWLADRVPRPPSERFFQKRPTTSAFALVRCLLSHG